MAPLWRPLRLREEGGDLWAGELVRGLGMPQAPVSPLLVSLRWCGFVSPRRENRSVIYRLADPRVSELVAIAESLLDDNAEHVACCSTIDPS